VSKPTTIAVNTPSATYEVHIGTGLLSTIGPRLDTLVNGSLTSGKRKLFIITSPNIWNLWGQQLRGGLTHEPTPLFIEPGEQHKRLSTVEHVLEALAESGADRDSLLLAFGGGVIGDMAGFIAAIYMRGIPYVQVPTTALAQIDSSVGGKTGANLAHGKNLVGAFHHPLAVFADIDTLSTLPTAELRAGLQEAVKAGIIRDRALFDYLYTNREAVLAGNPAALQHVIAESVRIKAEVVGADERESGLRMILNLGHTLGHAIEAATEYKQLLHGEAIAWGMLAAAAIAKRRGLMTVADHDRVERVILTYGPLKRFEADSLQLVALTAKDKKNRSGGRNFILPRGIGEAVVVNDVTAEELTFTAERMMAMVARQEAV
jgi:3-dehydroquinate synthase